MRMLLLLLLFAATAAAQVLPARVVPAPDGKKLVIHCGDWAQMVGTAQTVGYDRFLEMVETQFGSASYHLTIATDAAGYGDSHAGVTYGQAQEYCIAEAERYWTAETDI